MTADEPLQGAEGGTKQAGGAGGGLPVAEAGLVVDAPEPVDSPGEGNVRGASEVAGAAGQAGQAESAEPAEPVDAPDAAMAGGDEPAPKPEAPAVRGEAAPAPDPSFGGPPGFMLQSTGCGALDAMLDGGLESDAVTLVFGEGGSGKTNLALQCSREAAANGRVAFVDTEGVSPRRLAQVMQGCPEDVARRLHFFKPLDLDQQTKMVEQATKLPGLRLIVLDSINMHYRLHMDSEDERMASRHLYRQLHRLTAFARSQEVPVLVTGQVYGDEDQTFPFARRLLEHLVKASVRFEKRPDGLRRATIVKHRSIEEGRRARFRITETGLAGEAPEHGGARS